jgi:hypothetical protein
LQESHSALAIGKHGTGAHVKNTAPARAGMNHAGRENSCQQTATRFHRCRRSKFIFHFQISKLRECATALSG